MLGDVSVYQLLGFSATEEDHLSHVMRKPTRSDANQAVQLQEMVRDLKFRI